MQDELFVVDRALQVRLELQPPQRGVVHRWLEDLVAVLARLFRDVHRDVGVPQQLLGALGPGRSGPRRTSRSRCSRERRPLCPRGGTGPRARARIRAATSAAPTLVAAVLEKDRELVAAEPRRRVRRSQTGPQPFPTSPSRRSPAAWPRESFIVLKSSRSMNSTDDGLLVASLPLQRVLDAVAEQGAVGEARDRVVEGLMRELLLERLALGDVARC